MRIGGRRRKQSQHLDSITEDRKGKSEWGGLNLVLSICRFRYSTDDNDNDDKTITNLTNYFRTIRSYSIINVA